LFKEKNMGFDTMHYKDDLENIPNEKFPARATGTEAEVCYDIAKRQELGKNKYGMSLDENMLKKVQWLQHAYEECLDQAIYLKKLIKEMKK